MGNARRIAGWGIGGAALALALLASGCGASRDPQPGATVGPRAAQSTAPASAIPVEKSYLICSQSCPDPTPRQVCKDMCGRRFNRCLRDGTFSEDTCEVHYVQCVGLCEANHPRLADPGSKKP